MSSKKKLLQIFALFEQESHVGGGSRSVELFKKNLKIKYIFENQISLKDYLKLFKKKRTNKLTTISSYYYPQFFQLLANSFLFFWLGNHLTIAHGLWHLELKMRDKKPGVMNIIYNYCSQWFLFLMSHKILIFSQYEQRLIEKCFSIFAHKTQMIPAYVKPLHSPVSKKNSRNLLKISQNKKILLIVSRLEKRKGIKIALNALALIKNKDLLLYIVYPENKYSSIEHHLSLQKQVKSLKLDKQVKFISGVNFDKVFLYYFAADLFIMSSTSLETLGWTTLEALSCGCPVVAFNRNATPEILNHIDRNLIIKKTSAKALAKKIKTILSLSLKQYQQLQLQSKTISSYFNQGKFINFLKRTI